jgi:tetratricopeptide (TPR) repeat protein
MGDVPQAIEQFRRAAEQDAKFSGAQISWALILSARGDFKESIEHFEKAIQLGADTPDMHNNLGDAYRKSSDTARAIEQYEIAVKLNPSFMLGYANLAQTLAMVDRSKEALAISDKAMEAARLTGQQEALEQFEEWLKHYQTELRRAAEAASPPQSPKAQE